MNSAGALSISWSRPEARRSMEAIPSATTRSRPPLPTGRTNTRTAQPWRSVSMQTCRTGVNNGHPPRSPEGADMTHDVDALLKRPGQGMFNPTGHAGTLPAKEAVKVRPADWHRIERAIDNLSTALQVEHEARVKAE